MFNFTSSYLKEKGTFSGNDKLCSMKVKLPYIFQDIDFVQSNISSSNNGKMWWNVSSYKTHSSDNVVSNRPFPIY